MTYSHTNPSPRYREMLAYYEQLHVEGEPERGKSASDTFDGRSLVPHVNALSALLKAYRSKSLIDYGCGKAKAYTNAVMARPDGTRVVGLKELWSSVAITLFDPGNPQFQTYPAQPADAVVCTDVLEHIPEEDIGWVVDELFRLSNQFIFVSIACYPAQKTLPNGENAHITLKSTGWWLDLLEAASLRHGKRDYYATIYKPDYRQTVLHSAPVPWVKPA